MVTSAVMVFRLVAVHGQLLGIFVDGHIHLAQPAAIVPGGYDGGVTNVDRFKERLVLVTADHQVDRFSGVDQLLGDGCKPL